MAPHFTYILMSALSSNTVLRSCPSLSTRECTHCPSSRSPSSAHASQQCNHCHHIILDPCVPHSPEQVHRLCGSPSVCTTANYRRPCYRVPLGHLMTEESQRSVHLTAPHVHGEHAVPRGHRPGRHFVEHFPRVLKLPGRCVQAHEAGRHVSPGRREGPGRARARVEGAAVGERPGTVSPGGDRGEEGGE
jgi:hypothetical protein